MPHHTIRDLPKSGKEILITGFDDEILSKAEKRALQKLQRQTNLKGFRPGKVPEAMVKEVAGEEQVRVRTLEEALPLALEHIAHAEKIAFIGRPRVEWKKLEPLDIRVEWDVFPTLELEKKIVLKPFEKKAPEKEEEKAAFEQEKMEYVALQLAKSVKGDIPKTMIDQEVFAILMALRHNIERAGIRYEDYLKSVKKTAEEMMSMFQEQGEHRIRYQFAIRLLAEREGIPLTDKDLVKKVLDKVLPKG